MKQNWVALSGKIEYADGVITHLPVANSDIPGTDSIPFTVARSNIEFFGGTISLEAKLAESKARCQIVVSAPQSMQIFAGLNAATSAYGIALFANNQWRLGVSAGFGDTPDADRWIEIKLRVRGSNVDLFIDEVRVCRYTETIQKGPVGLFFQSASQVQVRNFRVESAKPVVFVVMQFTDDYNSLYREVIKPTCEKFEYAVVRADDTFTSGLIIEDITNSIRDAAIVIADITPDNPNVFYEVGYAHGIGKPTLLLSDKKRDSLPFDVSGFRTLFYDNTIGGKRVVEERLTKHLEHIER